jgi:hypothetical protein
MAQARHRQGAPSMTPRPRQTVRGSEGRESERSKEMMKPRLLDLFCGAGGAAVGYSRAGFWVVGVDVRPQPHYPFEFHQAEALEFAAKHAMEFDAVHASPPCQRWSIGNRPHHSAENHPDLVGPFRDLIRPLGVPYVIENVGGAPLIQPYMLCGTMFGLKVFRHRYFETLLPIFPWPQHVPHDGSTGSHRGYSTLRSGRNGFICVAGHNFERGAAAEAMGIDWMGSRYELAQAIPPAYTLFIGRQLMSSLEQVA